MKLKKSLVTVGTVAVILFSGAFATEPVSAAKNLKDVQNERKELKVELTKAEKEVAKILKEIREIDAEIKQLEESINENSRQQKKTKQEIKKLESEIEKLQEEIDQIQEEIDKRNEILKTRIAAYQENGGNTQFIEVFLGAKSFMDFISRISAVTTITNADQELIEEHIRDQEKIEKKKNEVEEKLDVQEELFAELKTQAKLIKEQKEAVEEGKKELKEKEKELNAKISKLKSKDQSLARIEAQLSEPIPVVTSNSPGNNIQKASQTYSGGKLAWPTVGGYISSPMGYRWGSYHKGIDIARTDRSTSPPIFAAESGTVEVAQFHNNGYGNYIVINHGNGMKTVYAHLASISVKPGQKVSRGQTIGIMGATGRSTGIHLHFEVHVNGKVQNPVNYLK